MTRSQLGCEIFQARYEGIDIVTMLVTGSLLCPVMFTVLCPCPAEERDDCHAMVEEVDIREILPLDGQAISASTRPWWAHVIHGTERLVQSLVARWLQKHRQSLPIRGHDKAATMQARSKTTCGWVRNTAYWGRGK
jgi:hypothetical protein